MKLATAPHLGGHCNMTNTDPVVLDELIRRYAPMDTMLDVGCGPGGMLDLALARDITAVGIDGDPVLTEHNRRIVLHDYTCGPLLWMNVDLIWCVEFVEHVEAQFQGNYLTTFRAGRVLLMSHALPGQVGYHHVNCQNSAYWTDVLTADGWTKDNDASWWVRTHATNQYIAQTGMVFTR